ncbi:siderophore-interacting protein [Acinetobacter larvae]|uniref:NADPH-dependent ferric siderophore reductase n=1 Tax=Acinetobacter larvae TaxID=1789224 RepID=A0A1B2M0S7_9GAMM|nr:siderophore-interacting protein [Acinetobacter larvae]AOA58797.1 NADPH-dependent ferric siderophore reductase [Acinetobacter larvae]
MAKSSNTLPRHIQVQSSIQLSPNMQRIYFSSDDFSSFPPHTGGAHIKLFFPEQQHLIPALPYKNELGKVTWPDGKKPITRTYTVRNFDQSEQLLVVDFVRHEAFGIAAHWASCAQKGDILGLAGPGGPARFNPAADYFIFIGDLSALPMIAASLEQLNQGAQGEVWIEIEHADDQQNLQHPQGIKIHWLQNAQDIEAQIAAALAQLDWEKLSISVSLAGENNRVVNLRNILRTQYQINKSNLYAVPYWKQGHTEESYHDERHSIMDNEG